jgi:hypothetical protein
MTPALICVEFKRGTNIHMFFMLVYILDTLFKTYFAQQKPLEHCSNAHIYVHLSGLHYSIVLKSVL